MSKCPDCGTEMKPLATSVYCPNDCDRKVTEHIDPERTEKIYFFDTTFTPSGLQQNMGGGTVIADPLFSNDDIDEWIDNLFDDSTD